MFFTILIIAVILVIIMLVLPYASGLTKIEIDTHHKVKEKKQTKKSASAPSSSQQYGYVPPDEIQPEDDKSQEHKYFKEKASAIKDKFQVTSEDMPLKIKLSKLDNTDANLRHRKKEKLDIDTNPNNYDYDIDELIAEENDLARKEQQSEFYKDQEIGKEREEMV
ncbi:hypothetical protein SBY92_003080 [Candida maltosa Xu316]